MTTGAHVTVYDTHGLNFTVYMGIVVENVAPQFSLSWRDSMPDPQAQAGVDAVVPLTATLIARYSDPGPTDSIDHANSFIDWGDGSSRSPVQLAQAAGQSSRIMATHAYAAEGVYIVSLTLTDNDGGARTESSTIRVIGGLEATEDDEHGDVDPADAEPDCPALPPLPLPAPRLLSPESGIVFPESIGLIPITLSWEPVDGASHYFVLVDCYGCTAPDVWEFDSAFPCDGAVVEGTTLTIEWPGNGPPGRWRVTAHVPCGDECNPFCSEDMCGIPSEWRSFTISGGQ